MTDFDWLDYQNEQHRGDQTWPQPPRPDSAEPEPVAILNPMQDALQQYLDQLAARREQGNAERRAQADMEQAIRQSAVDALQHAFDQLDPNQE